MMESSLNWLGNRSKPIQVDNSHTMNVKHRENVIEKDVKKWNRSDYVQIAFNYVQTYVKKYVEIRKKKRWKKYSFFRWLFLETNGDVFATICKALDYRKTPSDTIKTVREILVR